jgi:hypothetical protein
MQALRRLSFKCPLNLPPLEALAGLCTVRDLQTLCEPSTSGRTLDCLDSQVRRHNIAQHFLRTSSTSVLWPTMLSGTQRLSQQSSCSGNWTGIRICLQQQRLYHKERGGGKNTFLSVSNKEAVEYQRLGQMPEGPFEVPLKQVFSMK